MIRQTKYKLSYAFLYMFFFVHPLETYTVLYASFHIEKLFEENSHMVSNFLKTYFIKY